MDAWTAPFLECYFFTGFKQAWATIYKWAPRLLEVFHYSKIHLSYGDHLSFSHPLFREMSSFLLLPAPSLISPSECHQTICPFEDKDKDKYKYKDKNKDLMVPSLTSECHRTICPITFDPSGFTTDI